MTMIVVKGRDEQGQRISSMDFEKMVRKAAAGAGIVGLKMLCHRLLALLVERLLRDQRLRFAMAKVAGRGADQLGNLMAVLEFGAVDFEHGA